MNDQTASSSYKHTIGIAAFCIILLHILISLFTVVAPAKLVRSNLVTSYYNRLILLGPFFQDSRIRSSPHLYVCYKVNGVWSPLRDYGMESFKSYRENPWRYDKLYVNDFERYLSDRVARQNEKRFGDISVSKKFRELNQFVLGEFIKKPVDSVMLVYGHNRYLPEKGTFHFDTVFSYNYNPQQVDHSKNQY